MLHKYYSEGWLGEWKVNDAGLNTRGLDTTHNHLNNYQQMKIIIELQKMNMSYNYE